MNNNFFSQQSIQLNIPKFPLKYLNLFIYNTFNTLLETFKRNTTKTADDILIRHNDAN